MLPAVDVTILTNSVGFGVVTASILCLGAVGFTMQFGITNYFNLAFASVMAACAFIAYVANHAGLNIWLAMVIAAVAGAAISVLLNRLVYAPFARRLKALYQTLIVTLATAFFLNNFLLAIVGTGFLSYSAPPGHVLRFSGVALTPQQLEIIALAVVTMLGTHLLLTQTKLGKAMRATAANPALARSCRINTSRVIDLAWGISGALCGIAGVTVALNTTSFGVDTESNVLVLVIAAAILGGVGRPYGAMAGALVVGVSTEVAAALGNPLYKEVVALVILVIVLLARPQGLFGARESRAVTR
jgi:branched-chain amino acid transport system permease protein/neutral amino acid transport system permease protein